MFPIVIGNMQRGWIRLYINYIGSYCPIHMQLYLRILRAYTDPAIIMKK